jgi:hypothetical protein
MEDFGIAQIRIFEHVYQLKVVDNIHQLASDGKSFVRAVGHTSYQDAEISLLSGPARYKNEPLTLVLMHECVHAILNSMERQDLNDDEKFVELLAKHFHNLLRENPSIAKIFVDRAT